MSDGKFRSYRKSSREIDWGTSIPGTTLTVDQINTGCMLRIADATEKMAQRHTELINQRDGFKRDVKYWRNRTEVAERSNAALRGHITKLKKVAARWMFWRQHYKALTAMDVATNAELDLTRTFVTTPTLMDEVTDEAIKKGK